MTTRRRTMLAAAVLLGGVAIVRGDDTVRSVAIMASPGAAIHLMDLDARDPARVAALDLTGGAARELPRKPIALVQTSGTGGATVTLVDMRTDRRDAIRLPLLRKNSHAIVLRVTRTRAARSKDLAAIVLRDVATRETYRPVVLGDALAFNDLPPVHSLEIAPGASLCLQTAADLRFGKASWIFRDVEVGTCSDLAVTVEGAGDISVAPELRLRDVDEAGKPRDVLQRVAGSRSARFDNLRPALYAVDAVFSGDSAAFTTTEMVSVGAEASVTQAISIHAVRIQGSVTWGSNAAVGQLKFSSKRDAKRLALEVEIGPEGTYDALFPDPGRYFVSLKTPSVGHGPWNTVEVPSADDSVIDIHFPLTRLSGNVVNPAGEPIGGVTVVATVKSADAANMGTVTSDDLGHFVFDGSIPGMLTLEASKKGYRQLNPIDGVTLAEDADLEERIVLQKIHGARVTVRDPDGAPGANLHIYCAGPSLGPDLADLATTDSAGEAELDTENRLPMACTIPNGVGALEPRPVTGTDPLEWTLSSPVGAVVVNVLDESEKPVQGSSVLLRSGGQFLGEAPLDIHVSLRGGMAVTNKTGSAYLPGLAPGWTEVYVGRGPALLMEAASGDALGRAAAFNLQAGEKRAITVHLTTRN